MRSPSVRHRRGRVASALGLGLGLFLTSVATDSSSAASTPTTHWPADVVSHHVFVRGFTLAAGSVRVVPWSGHVPSITRTQVTTMWASFPLAGRVRGLGWGVVTLRGVTQGDGPRVTPLVRAKALIGIVDGSGITRSCPAMTVGGHYSHVTPVSDGWQAVIVPLDPHLSEVVVSARSNICGHLVPTTVVTALEVLSVRWHLSSDGHVVVSIPACSRLDAYGGGGNLRTGQMSFRAFVYLNPRPLAVPCSVATNFDAGSAYASPRTTHGATGPVTQVGGAGISF